MWQPMSPRAPLPKSHQPSPGGRHVGRMIGPLADRAEPEVPVERRGHGRRIRRAADPLLPQRPARSDQTWTSRTSPMTPAWIHSLVSRAPSVACPWLPICVITPAARAALVKRAAFVQRVRQRLLAVDVLAGADRGQRGHGVDVVGRADGDGVDVLRFLVEHDAEILVAPGLREMP